MAGGLELKWTDFDGDNGSVTFEMAEPASDGSNYSAWLAAGNGLRDAVNAVCGGYARSDTKIADINDNGVGAATSPVYQKHISLIVEYTSSGNGQTYRYRIPAPKLDAQDGESDPLFVKSGGLTVMEVVACSLGATFVTQFEANVLHDGNAVTFQRAYIEE